MSETVIESAKEYAHKQGVSLSSLVENYFKNATGISSPKQKGTPTESSLTKGLIGIIKHVNYEEEDYRMHQGKKHGIH